MPKSERIAADTMTAFLLESWLLTDELDDYARDFKRAAQAARENRYPEVRWQRWTEAGTLGLRMDAFIHGVAAAKGYSISPVIRQEVVGRWLSERHGVNLSELVAQ